MRWFNAEMPSPPSNKPWHSQSRSLAIHAYAEAAMELAIKIRGLQNRLLPLASRAKVQGK
jgi:hypothetical protein